MDISTLVDAARSCHRVSQELPINRISRNDMTASHRTPIYVVISPTDKARFIAYHKRHSAWGSLHVILESGNVKDHSADACVQYAQSIKDTEGEYLAKIVRNLSPSQRFKLPNWLYKS